MIYLMEVLLVVMIITYVTFLCHLIFSCFFFVRRAYMLRKFYRTYVFETVRFWILCIYEIKIYQNYHIRYTVSMNVSGSMRSLGLRIKILEEHCYVHSLASYSYMQLYPNATAEPPKEIDGVLGQLINQQLACSFFIFQHDIYNIGKELRTN